MTQDEIIDMARQVGFWKEHTNTWMCNSQDIEAFAKLVDAKAIAKEREECCEAIDEIDDGEAPEYRACQEAIRARSSK